MMLVILSQIYNAQKQMYAQIYCELYMVQYYEGIIFSDLLS